MVLLFGLSRINKDGPLALFGINFKTMRCPDCDFKQPFIRKPKNKRQAMWGGNTCKACGCEMDKYGNKV